MRRVRTAELLLARGRDGLQVAAHVAGGQPDRPQAADGEVREVLADALAQLQQLRQRGLHRRGALAVAEVVVDAVQQAPPPPGPADAPAPAPQRRTPGSSGPIATSGDGRVCSASSTGSVLVGQRLRRLCHRPGVQRSQVGRGPVDVDDADRGDREFGRRRPALQVDRVVAEVVGVRGDQVRRAGWPAPPSSAPAAAGSPAAAATRGCSRPRGRRRRSTG